MFKSTNSRTKFVLLAEKTIAHRTSHKGHNWSIEQGLNLSQDPPTIGFSSLKKAVSR